MFDNYGWDVMENQRRRFIKAAVYTGLFMPNLFSIRALKATTDSNEINFNFRHIEDDYIEINGWVLHKTDLT